MSKYLILILFVAGCACLGLPTTAPTIIPTPVEQLWQAAKQGNWLVAASILGIAGGVFALMNGSKLGVPAVVTSCVSLFMTLAVARFALWMAACGLIGSVLACVTSILLKNKALVEIIKGVQKAKDNMGGNIQATPDVEILKEELAIQSKPTQRLVQTIKGNLKVKGEI